MWGALVVVILFLIWICQSKSLDRYTSWSFGFGGYPTGRPYCLYSQAGYAFDPPYGACNSIKYVGGIQEFPGGPNFGELYRQWP